ncbi:MAG: DNA topoisomerase I [Euryarchaeota archaeon]|nr:DNA topoisomerase I [Euryarchaeota archaeon]|tara:strand:- start:1289 stop:3616 length:2328 start_codon:yes stop_codon:yes gene_type:complete
MPKNLVIVESPAKAKTIEGYLGKDFVVKSSFGHIRDLPKGNNAIDIENDFTPNYEISADKKQVISDLKKEVKKTEVVWLATDEDREGEAISWHLVEALKLKPENTKRIVFHEITKSAILKAIENPRSVNKNLVDAQQARRVLDRLVGFELSPILWRKVKQGLSAGRVQSVGVRIIIDREREILAHKASSKFRVVGEFTTQAGKLVKAECKKRFETEGEAEKFLEACSGSTHKVWALETKPAKKKPTAPFTTSTLQQEASRKLGFSVQRTMSVAQKLYEAGLITYMRTDSVILSDQALDSAASAIAENYGDEYCQRRTYTNKNSSAQEAHEAIRPTDFTKSKHSGTADQEKLYGLIWRRGIASQMADARLEKTTATIDISGSDEKFVAKGEVVTFEGFLKVYLEGTDDENDDEAKGLLPAMVQGENMDRKTIVATQRFANHPPRYTEASLVKKLEELGIGRPSTYASTISTIQNRGYVHMPDREGTKREYRVLTLDGTELSSETAVENTGAEKNKLAPTDIGKVVNDFLIEHFGDILEYNFTADVEKKFDVIASGKDNWQDMIREFYKPFKVKVDTTLETAERASGERILGVDPDSGKQVLVRIGRFGPMAQLGKADDEDKRFSSLRAGQTLDSITLDDTLLLFKLPRDLGEFEGKKVVTDIGRFGPYVRHDGKFISIKKGTEDDPYTLELNRAIELIEAKRAADAAALLVVFEEDPDVRIIEGRWGPYIKAGKMNVKIPKGEDYNTIDWKRAQELIEEHSKRPATKRKRGKAKQK